MLSGDLLKMVVNDLASLEVLVIKMQHAELGLGDCRKEFFFDNLGVFTVTLGNVLFELFSLSLKFANALFTHDLHNFFITVRVEIRIAVLTLLFLFLFLLMTDHVALIVHHLLLDFKSLVLDSLLHDHFVENVALHLHAFRGSFFSHFVQIYVCRFGEGGAQIETC